MKKVLPIGILLVAALSPVYPVLAQERGSAEKPITGSPNKPNDKEPAETHATASIKSAADGEKRNKSASSNSDTGSDEATLTSIYRVGVGDILDIRLPNSETNRSTLFTIMDGGVIEFPLAGGSMTVAGLTTDEIQALVAAELKRRAVQDKAQVSVGVRQYVSHTVMVTGLAGIPGTKTLRREAVPLYVVLAESQPRLDATRATIMRSGALFLTVDFGDPASLSVLIRPGDVINLTARPKEFYYIAGGVNYPGQKDFQTGITLLQAILAAGGLARPSNNVVELSRDGANGLLSTTKYNLREIKSGKAQDPRIQPGDRIEVVR